MRILWLGAGLLLPLDKGGRLRTWHLMRHLAAHHDITYLSFREPSTTSADLEGMRQVCAALDTVPRRDPAKGTLRFHVDAARFVVHPFPTPWRSTARPSTGAGSARCWTASGSTCWWPTSCRLS